MAHDHARNTPAEHLHSHLNRPDRAEDMKVLAAEFVESFRAARDKAAFLRLAGVPLEIEDEAGGPSLKLVDLRLITEWQVGTAAPSFGSRDLSYQPFPGPMIRERENLAFVYVSLERRREVDLRAFLAARPEI